METMRLNPVTLVTGATTKFGAACARWLSPRSKGGLILVDPDEDALSRMADTLPEPPERVSMLALDASDEARWAQAAAFIESQYGRLDWAVVHTGAVVTHSELITDTDLRPDALPADLNIAYLTMRAAMPLMRKNIEGGSIIVSASAGALKTAPDGSVDGRTGLLQLMRMAAQVGAHENIRANAIAPGGPGTPGWDQLPWMNDLVRETGSERDALDAVGQRTPPIARYQGAEDMSRLIELLLSDGIHMTGATLVVDGGYTL